MTTPMPAVVPILHDAHCHLDFAQDPISFAEEACRNKSHIFANTVTPQGYVFARQKLDAFATNIHLGLGLHPWYISQVDSQIDAFLANLDSTRYVGEIGLDFGKKKADSAKTQLRAFLPILDSCAAAGGKVLSIHAIKSAETVLNLLEETKAIDSCTCILHWFSGSNDQLRRAIRLGCFFSVGPFMAASRRGMEYIKVIPTQQLLLETDYPSTKDGASIDAATGEPRVSLTFEEVQKALGIAAAEIVRRKGVDSLQAIEETSLRILKDP